MRRTKSPHESVERQRESPGREYRFCLLNPLSLTLSVRARLLPAGTSTRIISHSLVCICSLVGVDKQSSGGRVGVVVVCNARMMATGGQERGCSIMVLGLKCELPSAVWTNWRRMSVRVRAWKDLNRVCTCELVRAWNDLDRVCVCVCTCACVIRP